MPCLCTENTQFVNLAKAERTIFYVNTFQEKLTRLATTLQLFLLGKYELYRTT
jgi:hypothetical protein